MRGEYLRLLAFEVLCRAVAAAAARSSSMRHPRPATAIQKILSESFEKILHFPGETAAKNFLDYRKVKLILHDDEENLYEIQEFLVCASARKLHILSITALAEVMSAQAR